MGNVPSLSPMPAHLRGRASMGGPVTGSYIMLTGYFEDVAATKDEEIRVIAPCDMQIVEASISVIAVSGAGVTATIQIAGISLISALTLVAGVDTAFTPGGANKLVEVVRDIAKGDNIKFKCNQHATESAEGVSFSLTCIVLGHVAALATEDYAGGA